MTVEATLTVELWTAPLPIVGLIAEHFFFLVGEGARKDRWEVWQASQQCPTSWGFLHLNLLPPTAAVGGRPARRIHAWQGDIAATLAARIRFSPASYPWLSSYRCLPGPNSNTYVQWILGSTYALPWRGIGRGYAGRHGRLRRGASDSS